MNNNVNRDDWDILEGVYNSGKYYQHGLDWFLKKNCYCLVIYNWSIVIIITLILVIVSMYLNTMSMLPISETVPFVIYADFNIDEQRALIKKLATTESSQKSINDAVSEYIIGQYVKNREEYHYKKLEEQSLIVKNNSFFQVYKDFFKSLDLRNKESPILKYKNNTTVTVDILSISLYIIDSINASANVKIRKNLSTGEQLYESISLKYQISDIYLAYKKIVPLEFMVVEYEKNI